MALTDTEIRKAKAKGKPYRLSDGGGLYLFVTPAGGKLWRWKYRFERREKLMTFGSYPDVSPSLAGERHAAARKLLATGTDPMAERKAEKAAAEDSFQSVARVWWEHWRDGKNPRHADYVKRRMDVDILPCLGARPVAAIEAPEPVSMVKAIEARGARDIAKRALETTGQPPARTNGSLKAKTVRTTGAASGQSADFFIFFALIASLRASSFRHHPILPPTRLRVASARGTR